MSQASGPLGSCTSSPWSIQASSNELYVLCANDAGSQYWIVAVPIPANPLSMSGSFTGTVVVSGSSLMAHSFAVANDNIYYADGDSVYKVAASGGSPSVILDSSSVTQLLVVGGTLYVASSCGVQAVGI